MTNDLLDRAAEALYRSRTELRIRNASLNPWADLREDAHAVLAALGLDGKRIPSENVLVPRWLFDDMRVGTGGSLRREADRIATEGKEDG